MPSKRAEGTQEWIVNDNLREWAGTKAGRFYRRAWAGAFVGLMICVWVFLPTACPILGPLVFFKVIGFDFCGLVVLSIQVVLVFAFLIKPHILTAIISMIGVLLWFLMGLLMWVGVEAFHN